MTQDHQAQCQTRTPGAADPVTSMVEKARSGDRTAFEQLFDLYREEVFRMVFYRTHSRMDAEDLTQEIFLQAFKNLSKLKDVNRFRPWLFSITVNRVRDFGRKKRLLTFLGFSSEEDDAEKANRQVHPDPSALDELVNEEFWRQVKSLSEKFSYMEKEVFFLRFMDQLNIKEIAQVLDKSESAVKTHLYRAIKKFKDDAAFSQFLKGDWQ